MKIIKPTSPYPLLRGEEVKKPLLAGEAVREYHRTGEVRHVPALLKTHSRSLRHDQTPQETLLWHHLKNRSLNGLKFRRQHPIGSFIADFCCMEKYLIIELDGGHHNEPENISKDQQRDVLLSSSGYTILRLWNSEIDENLDGVLEKILEITQNL